MKIFISSVQKEFVAERRALTAYLAGDPLLRRFFETFLFERDVPASDRRPDAVYHRQYIERMGTGTRDMIRKCLAAGLPEPDFTLTDSFVTTIRKLVTDPVKEVKPEKSSVKSSVKSSGKTPDRILDLLADSPSRTIPELAETLSLTTRAIEKQIKQLQSANRLRRIGPAKGGHWEVLEKGNKE